MTGPAEAAPTGPDEQHFPDGGGRLHAGPRAGCWLCESAEAAPTGVGDGLPDRLDEIRARRDGITPGEWETTPNHRILGPPPQLPSHSLPRDLNPVAEASNAADAEFIAHAPADVGWLLEHIEQLQAANAGLRGDEEAASEAYRRLQAQRQAVLDRCALAPRKAPTADYMRLVADIRAALGAADER